MKYITETGRITAIDDEGKRVGTVTYIVENGVGTINHTYVDNSQRGQGVASELVRRAVEKIKEEGYEVEATCSYAKMWLERK